MRLGTRAPCTLALALLCSGTFSTCGSPADDDSTAGDDDSALGDDDSAPGDDDSAPGDDDTAPGDDDSATGDDDVLEDADGDGFYNDVDCHDDDASAYPGSHATEVPLDGIDQDCDGLDACVDLSCDGYPDLVFTNHHAGMSGCEESIIYFGSGDGYDSGTSQLLDTQCAAGTSMADLDADGFLDLVFSANSTDFGPKFHSLVYWGSATGYSEANRTGLSTDGAHGLGVDDLDGDGWLDLVFSVWALAGVHETNSLIFWGSAAGFSDANRTELPTYGALGNAIADLDGDGYKDVVFANYGANADNLVDSYIYWGSASGFDPADRTDLPGRGPHGVLAADLDGDGFGEVVLANYFDGQTHELDSTIYWGSASGFDEADRTDLPTFGAVGLAARDLDDDGYTDLLVSNSTSHLGMSLHVPDSSIFWGSATGFDEANRTDLPTRGAYGTSVNDLDDDGWLDLVIVNYFDVITYDLDSYVYWGSASGFSESDRTDLPTHGAFDVSSFPMDQGY
jgi:hypothetical protein